MILAARLRVRRRARHRRARPGDQGGHRGRGGRIGRDRARAAARLPDAGRLAPHAHARRRERSPAARSAPACWPHSRSAAGSSSASTRASARPRRRTAPRGTFRGRSGSRCSASAPLVMLNAVAARLAHPNPADVVAGRDVDPGSTAVVTSFGSWSAKPFAAVVLVAFLACGMAAQALTARTIYSVARDDVLPGSRFLRTSTAARRRSARSSRRPSSAASRCCSD